MRARVACVLSSKYWLVIVFYILYDTVLGRRVGMWTRPTRPGCQRLLEPQRRNLTLKHYAQIRFIEEIIYGFLKIYNEYTLRGTQNLHRHHPLSEETVHGIFLQYKLILIYYFMFNTFISMSNKKNVADSLLGN